MLEIIRLARRRHRSPGDYRAMQKYIAERAVAEIEARGIDLGGCDILETAAGSGGYSGVLNRKAKTFLANDMGANPYFEQNDIPFMPFDLASRFPLESDSFDLIFSSSLIEHVSDPAQYLQECRRVLRPDGTLYLSFPPFYSLAMVGAHGFQPFHFLGERACLAIVNRLRGTNARSYATSWPDYGLYPLTINGVAGMLKANGYRVTDSFTRMFPVNTARLPGFLKDLATWHVCYLARPDQA